MININPKYLAVRGLMKKLAEKGITVKSPQAMNKILCDMGMQDRLYGFWRLTDLGEKYSMYNKDCMRPDMWDCDILPLIVKYLTKG